MLHAMEPLLASQKIVAQMSWACRVLWKLSQSVLIDLQFLDFRASPDTTFEEQMPAPKLVALMKDLVAEEFKDTHISNNTSFVRNATKVACELITTHPIVVMGQSNSGKSTLVNKLYGDVEHEAPLHTGLYPEDATTNAQSVKVSMSGMEGVAFLLIDTRGWSHEVRSEFKQQYQDILKKQSLAGQHVPHVVIFCVQVTSFRNFNNKEKSAMKKEFQRFGRLSQFTIVVQPVATFSDTIASSELRKAQDFVTSLVKDIFAGSGAEVCEAMSTSCKDGETAQGVEELKARMHSKVVAQITSTEFRRLWCLALARQLQNETRKMFEDSPHYDSEWRLFGAAYRAILKACSKEPFDSRREPKPRNLGERPPWWILPEIPVAPCSWSCMFNLFQHRLLSPCVYLFCCLLLVLMVFLVNRHVQGELTTLRTDSLLWQNETTALEKKLSPMQITITQLQADKSGLQDALTKLQGESVVFWNRTRAQGKQAKEELARLYNDGLLWMNRTDILRAEELQMKNNITMLQNEISSLKTYNSELQDEKSTLQVKLQHVHSELQDEKSNLQVKLQHAQGELDNSIKRANMLQNEVDTLLTANSQLQNDNYQLQKQVEDGQHVFSCDYKFKDCGQALGLQSAGSMDQDDCRNLCCSVSSCSLWQWAEGICWWGDQVCPEGISYFVSGTVQQHVQVTR